MGLPQLGPRGIEELLGKLDRAEQALAEARDNLYEAEAEKEDLKARLEAKDAELDDAQAALAAGTTHIRAPSAARRPCSCWS